MFLRAYRRNDKRHLQQLFFEVVHNISHQDYTTDDLGRWAPVVPDREIWNRLDEQFCYVVEHHKSIVGFGSLNTSGMLEWLYVHPRHQGKGIAKALLRQIERQVRKQNRPTITAFVTTNASDFFQYMGYGPAVNHPESTPFPAHRFCMEKQLEPEAGPLAG